MASKAHMIPPHLADETASAAEQVLYREFATQLGAEWTVMHSVKWMARQDGRQHDGEADFILAHPRHGVLVLEVKGGTIRRAPGTLSWTSIDRGGQLHPIKDPFKQAARSMYALRDKLAESPETAGFVYRVARAVALPDILVGNGDLGPNMPRDLIIDSADLPTLAQGIMRALNATPGAHKPGPGTPGIAALVRMLTPPLALTRRGLVGAMRQEQAQFLRLTAQQYTLLDFLGGHRRVAIDGVAGSGKTLLALEQCRRLARQGFRTLFTCYNKALAAWARAQLTADLGAAMARVTVDNYHDLAARLVGAAGLPVLPEGSRTGDALSRYFADELPEQFIEALATLPDRFDAIVVDEGQDFADTWWVTLEALLADPTDGPLYIFYDDDQRIYNTTMSSTYPIPKPHFRLTHNCRTTQYIHEAALVYHHSADRPECDGPEGRRVVETSDVPADTLDALRRTLHELTQVEGVPAEEIMILSTRAANTSILKEGTKLGNLSLTWGAGGAGKVCARSIHTFKGLESPVVILAEPERAHADNRDALLYVALSRAQHHVVVLGNLPPANGKGRG